MSFLCFELRHTFCVLDFNSVPHGRLSMAKQVKSGRQIKAKIVPSEPSLEAIFICQYQRLNPCFPDVFAHKLTESKGLCSQVLGVPRHITGQYWVGLGKDLDGLDEALPIGRNRPQLFLVGPGGVEPPTKGL